MIVEKEVILMFKNPVRLLAQTITLVWAAFWVFFVVASAMAEPAGPGYHALVMVGLFAGSALLAFFRDRIGGVLLVLEGVALCVANFTYLHNPPTTRLFLLLTLVLPPLLAGLLLLTAHPRPRPQTGSA